MSKNDILEDLWNVVASGSVQDIAECGFDLNIVFEIKDLSMTTLAVAASFNSPQVVKYLIQQGVPITKEAIFSAHTNGRDDNLLAIVGTAIELKKDNQEVDEMGDGFKVIIKSMNPQTVESLRVMLDGVAIEGFNQDARLPDLSATENPADSKKDGWEVKDDARHRPATEVDKKIDTLERKSGSAERPSSTIFTRLSGCINCFGFAGDRISSK